MSGELFVQSQICEAERSTLLKALNSDSDSRMALNFAFHDLLETDREMLLAIAQRNMIKPLYAFGKLRKELLIVELTEAYLPRLNQLLSLDSLYFVVMYSDDPESCDISVDDLDIIEEPLSDFQCPEDAHILGCFSSEDEAYRALWSRGNSPSYKPKTQQI